MKGTSSAAIITSVAMVAVVAASILHLDRIQTNTLIVYTSPALRDLIEKDLIPRYRESGGLRVEPVYSTAGEQYNRLRMSGDDVEADLFLQASPLYIQKGTTDGYFLPTNPEGAPEDDALRGAPLGEGFGWRAFAWTPLVSVYHPDRTDPPDFVRDEMRIGFPHPRLSNNGLYVVVLLESLDPEAGRTILDRTVVQPVNARTTVGGVVDRSFEATIGYESVVKFYQSQGAKVEYGPIKIDGEFLSVAAIMSVGIVDGPRHEEARRFADFLYTDATSRAIEKYHYRTVTGGLKTDAVFEGEDVQFVDVDWSDVAMIDAALPKYEVGYVE